MLSDIISYACVALLTGIFLKYLNRATGKIVKPNGIDQYFLRMNKFYNIAGYIAMCICLVFIIGSIITLEFELAVFVMVFFIVIIFGGLGLLGVLLYRNHYLLFSSTKIEVRSVFGKTKITTWNKIQNVSFSQNSGLITITDDGQKLKVHQHLVGLSKFVAYLEDKTEWTVERLKLPVKRIKIEKHTTETLVN